MRKARLPSRTGLVGALLFVAGGCTGLTINVGTDPRDAGASGDAGPAPLEASVLLDGSNDAGAPDALSSDPEACAPPSGWIAFDSDRDGFKRDIFVIRTDGTGLTRLTNDPGTEQQPAIAPDGFHVAYASDAPGIWQVFVRDLKTGLSSQVTQLDGGADEPAWSPDGTLIAFHGGDEFAGAVYTIHPDGTAQNLVFVDPTAPPGCQCAYEYPVFTPDGESLIADRSNVIQMARLDGTQVTTLIPNGTRSAMMAAVSADGTLLAYVTACGVPPMLGDGVALTSLSNPASSCTEAAATNAIHPTFGPGGALAFTEGNPADILIQSQGCAHFNVTRNPADDENPRWAPPTFIAPVSLPPPPK